MEAVLFILFSLAFFMLESSNYTDCPNSIRTVLKFNFRASFEFAFIRDSVMITKICHKMMAFALNNLKQE